MGRLETCFILTLKCCALTPGRIWLQANGNYVIDRHYMDTMVYRFIVFFGYIQLIEKKLIYLDTTISDKSDLRTIKYFRLFHDIMCDVDLFSGLQYDINYATDHFFTTPFENMSNSLLQSDSVINLDTFLSLKPSILPNIENVYKYFDGINPSETRLRCERLKIFHLALISFLNEFGYDFQKTPPKRIAELKSALGEFKLLPNYINLIVKFKLNKWFGKLESVISSVK